MQTCLQNFNASITSQFYPYLTTTFLSSIIKPYLFLIREDEYTVHSVYLLRMYKINDLTNVIKLFSLCVHCS